MISTTDFDRFTHRCVTTTLRGLGYEVDEYSYGWCSIAWPGHKRMRHYISFHPERMIPGTFSALRSLGYEVRLWDTMVLFRYKNPLSPKRKRERYAGRR